uniref:Sel1 repeat family protein n=1 Tax=OCS116 cluster bacterium TaxID=2030921 RepID=A0A2A4YVW7_9PROT
MNKFTRLLMAAAFMASVASPTLADLAKGEAAFKVQDFATAKVEFEALPNSGSALYLLGLIHLNGMGIERDVKYGRELVLKSADIGYIPAQMSMGSAYKSGYELDKDLALAHYYYSLAGRYSSYNQEKADELAEQMSPQQLAKSTELFSKWK